jgi:hypothetical protein
MIYNLMTDGTQFVLSLHFAFDRRNGLLETMLVVSDLA